jgi:glutamine amidotransferase
MPLASIIDYGVGNLFSMTNSLKQTGLNVKIVKNPKEIDTDAIILPGVGNFGAAARNLSPFKQLIQEKVEDGTPLLGSCLGLQLLFERSEEGMGDGLGIFEGFVRRFTGHIKTPHMGWNTIEPVRQSALFKGIPSGSFFYFVHSYYVEPKNLEIILALTEYDIPFPSIVEMKNIIGTQFHPEKSGENGSKFLNNFADLLKM